MKQIISTSLTLVLLFYAGITHAQTPEQLSELEQLLNKGKNEMSGQDSVRVEINNDGMVSIHSMMYGYYAGDYSKKIWYTVYRQTFMPRFLDLDNVEVNTVHEQLLYPCKSGRDCVMMYLDTSGDNQTDKLFLNCFGDEELIYETKKIFESIATAMLK